MPYQPVVISLHGIRTRGEWQKRLCETLSSHGMTCVGADYGYLSLVGFLASAAFGGKIEWFRKKYEDIVNKYRQQLTDGALRRYPSLVAHSFGTMIAGLSMQKYEDIRFDKIIICGSILPPEFSWDLLFQRDQVSEVRHEYGMKDIWTRLGGRIVPHAGVSGAIGFGHSAPHFEEVVYEHYRHSDFFGDSHIESTWLPLLQKELPRFKVKHGREVKTVEEFEAIAKETFDIDARVFGTIPEYKEVEPDLSLAKQWLAVEPDVFTFLYDERAEKYVGYITALLVKPDRFEQVVSNGIVDKQMTPAVLASSHDGDAVCICAISIATDPAFRNVGEGYHTTQAYKLLSAFAQKLEYFARHRRVRVRQIAAVGWTDDGCRICEHIIGMKRVGKDKYGHPTYRLHLKASEMRKKRKPFKPLLRVAELYDELRL